jgi:hypothetical protein
MAAERSGPLCAVPFHMIASWLQLIRACLLEMSRWPVAFLQHVSWHFYAAAFCRCHAQSMIDAHEQVLQNTKSSCESRLATALRFCIQLAI